MVRFETKLRNNAIKEWIPFYLDYRLLKKILYSEDATAPKASTPALFSSPRFHSGVSNYKPTRSASRLNDSPDRMPLLVRSSEDSNDSSSHNAIAGQPEMKSPSSSVSVSTSASTKSTSKSTSKGLHIPLRETSSYLLSALSGAPPIGTQWNADAWEILKAGVMGKEYDSTEQLHPGRRPAGMSEIDVKMEEEESMQLCNEHEFRDEHGDLSPIPSLASDVLFRSTLLSEIAKMDTFYNDVVDDLQSQLAILQTQAKTTEELGKAKRRERSSRKKKTSMDRVSFQSNGSHDGNNVAPSSSSSSSSSTFSTKRNNLYPVVHQSSASSALARDIESIRDMDSPSREALALASSKRAYADLYRNMCYLENYCILNYTGIVKIIKKHDKINPQWRKMKPMVSSIRQHGHFPSYVGLEEIKRQHQSLYGNVFCGGDKDIARAELLLKRDDEATQSVKPFLLGFRFGICLLLTCWILWDVVIDFWYNQMEKDAEAVAQLNRITHKCHNHSIDKNISIAAVWFDKDFPVYRGMGSLVVWLWLWGVCLYVWNHARINYLFMFELDPRITATYTEVWSSASSLTIVLLTSFIIHFKVVICDFPGHPIPLGAWPMIPFAFLLYKMIFPWSSRKVAWGVALSVMAGPFVRVTFLMNYVGDVFTSLVKPIVDMTYTVCFFITGDFLQHLGEKGVCQNKDGVWSSYIVPIIVLGPYWFRFMQCIRRYYDTGKRHPNLPNALKYALAMCVTIFSVFSPNLKSHVDGSWTTYQVFWTICYTSSTLYTYSWDILMDWSLGDSKHGGLRERRMFRNKAVYYVAIVADLILRFFWSYTLIPVRDQSNFANGVSLSIAIAPFAAIAEICRRSMWSFFRLENEHLHNTSGYRKVNHIPLHFETPLKQSTTDSSGGKGTKSWHVMAEIVVIIVVVIVISAVAISYK